MICLDASVVGMLISPDEPSEELLNQYEQKRLSGESFISPPLLPFEIGSVLRKKELKKFLSREEILGALQYYRGLKIQLRDFDTLMERSLTLAQTFGPKLTVYDASYVAVAEKFQAPLWTADRELFEAVSPSFDFVVWVSRK